MISLRFTPLCACSGHYPVLSGFRQSQHAVPRRALTCLSPLLPSPDSGSLSPHWRSLSILCSLSLAFCVCSPEVTVTSLHPTRVCRLAVFSIKPTLPPPCLKAFGFLVCFIVGLSFALGSVPVAIAGVGGSVSTSASLHMIDFMRQLCKCDGDIIANLQQNPQAVFDQFGATEQIQIMQSQDPVL